MRRFALLGPLLGIVLILSGCAGLDDFLGNTFTYGTNPNLPPGDSMNMRRVQGLAAPAEAVLPESGNIWPKGVEPLPTLQDLEGQGRPVEPPRPAPRPLGSPVGSATPPPSLYQTQTGPASVTGGTEHYQTVNTPTGPGVAVPNGNGTATLIRADGSVETVPATR